MEDKKIIENDSQLIVGVNEKISCGKAAFLGSVYHAVDTWSGDRTGRRRVIIFPSDEFLCMWNCNYIAGGILHEVSYHTGTIVCTAWSYVYDRRDHGSQCNDRKSDTRSNHDRIAGYI